jgi:hypothetical protein
MVQLSIKPDNLATIPQWKLWLLIGSSGIATLMLISACISPDYKESKSVSPAILGLGTTTIFTFGVFTLKRNYPAYDATEYVRSNNTKTLILDNLITPVDTPSFNAHFDGNDETASDWGEADSNTTLENFFGVRGLSVQEIGIIEGFCKSRYQLKLAPNTPVKKVLGLEADMMTQLGVDAQISSQLGFIAVDVPSENREFVEYQPLVNPIKNGCAMLIGFDNFTREPIVVDLADANTPHACVAGVTGSGKTQWAITALKSTTDWYSPDQVQVIILDPKQDDTLAGFADCPHMKYPIIVEPTEGVAVLKLLNKEMKKRQGNKQKMPHIIVLIEEIADYLAKDSPVKDEAFDLLAPLLRKGRSAGIHIICSTQYPKNEILPTSISTNLPLKICFRLDRDYKAEIVLGDNYPATKLQGKGHGVSVVPGIGLVEFQSPYVSDLGWEKVTSPPVATELQSTVDYLESLLSLDCSQSVASSYTDSYTVETCPKCESENIKWLSKNAGRKQCKDCGKTWSVQN